MSENKIPYKIYLEESEMRSEERRVGKECT